MSNPDQQSIRNCVESQHTFYRSGKTRDTGFRIEQLKRLKTLLKENEDRLIEAVQLDLRKPAFETYGTELGLLYEEIDLGIKKIPKWSRPQKVSGSLVNFPSRNCIYSQPYGVSLVIGTWNYPILLSLQPAVSAIAAGNTVILKPSEHAYHTGGLLDVLIDSYFEEDFFTVVEGEAETAETLLDQPFDYIFFTGSRHVGKLVMEAAARQLTPVTLELGGKSPAIVDCTSDLETAAKRIIWAKFLNAGQTCVAPDYLLVEAACKETLIDLMGKAITEFYGEDPAQSPDYARIVNDNHFKRLHNLLGNGITRCGGESNSKDRYISPTILDETDWEDPVMQGEIFGPILPLLTFDRFEEVIQAINQRPTPLALYLFSSDDKIQEQAINRIEFGGGCINDTMMHLGNLNLPFGGKGSSGMGKYHGKAGFDTFSHKKSIMKKWTWIDFPFRYAPYKSNIKWLKKIFN